MQEVFWLNLQRKSGHPRLSMLDQMAIEFKVEDAVAEQRAYKVQRLRNRIAHVE